MTGWYGYPNAVALFLAPIVPLAIYLAKTYYLKLITKKQETLDPGLRANKSQSPHHKFKNFEFGTWLLFVSCILYLITAPLAIYYAKSTGGLIGLAAGIGTLLLIYKKTRWPSVIIGLVGIISILSIPQLGNIKQEVFAQDRSGQIRVAMWGEALALLSDRPILGAGLRSYVDRIVPYHTQVNGENIEIFHLQHNLFLSLWINIGLVGLFGFIWILISISNIQYSLFKKYKKLPTLHYFLISSIIIMLVMGLVDTPYMKNDLAVLFWGIIALLLISSYEKLEKFTT
ncbi:MAG: O-antigen ligase family protein [Candidatus Magasanikbacteria bacterium]